MPHAVYREVNIMFELRRAIVDVVNPVIQDFADANGAMAVESCTARSDWWNDCQVTVIPNAADATKPLIGVVVMPGLTNDEVAHLNAHGFKVTSHDATHTMCQFRPGAVR